MRRSIRLAPTKSGIKVYREVKGFSWKWLVALAIFVLIMTITFSEANGVGTPQRPNNSQPPTNGQAPKSTVQNVDDGDLSGGQVPQPVNPSPISQVPEPSTLLLLAGGLGATALWRNRRAKKT